MSVLKFNLCFIYMNNFIVGISTGNKNVKMSAGEIECSVLNFDFIKQCNNHGAQVNIIPQQNSETINLSGINALIVTGGGDINPKMYDQNQDDTVERVDDLRDSTELNLLKEAENKNIRTLAICRGHQLLNVYKGGTLHQDLKKSGFNEIEHQKPYDDARRYVHRINIEKETKLEGIVQANNFEVNSIHHQGIDKLGDDLIISARSEDDVIEGIEITNGWDAIGIQWHPEYLDDEPTNKIYDWLINS